MKYRVLGSSGLLVSELSLGSATFGGELPVAGVDLAQTKRLMDFAIDEGVNLIDTSNSYNAGVAEEFIGEALKGRRESVLVATKAGQPADSDPNHLGLSRKSIVENCELSLKRLGVDHIDIYQPHGWDSLTPVEETLHALNSLVESGKVRAIGSSNFSAWHLMKALSTSERYGFAPICSQQVYYSLLHREIEHELIPLALEHNIGTMVWSPLAGGLLSGKYQRNNDLSVGRRGEYNEPPVYDWEPVFDAIDVVNEIASDLGISNAQVCLAYLLQKPGITTVILGARNIEQLSSNLSSAQVILNPDALQRLDQAVTERPVYPYWHQQKYPFETRMNR